MTTYKTGSSCVSPTGSGTNVYGVSYTGAEPIFQITFNATHGVGQAGFFVGDYQNSPITSFPDSSVNVFNLCYGDMIGARHSILDTGTIRVNGTRSPAPFLFPDGTALAGMYQWSGTGAPSSSNIGGAARFGDTYFRRDGSAGTYFYLCTVSGTPGTWVAKA